MVTTYTIEEMRNIAAKHGGKCLSSTYTSTTVKLLWECKEGHKWEAIPGSVIKGSWCKICAFKNFPSPKRYTIENIKSIIEKKGGICLSDSLQTNKSRIDIQCEFGHKWDTTAIRIKEGSWCPICLGRGRTIEDMQNYASKKMGKCISQEFTTMLTPLVWECKEGHRWKAASKYVVNDNTWCPQCAHSIPKTIQDMKDFAQKRGGKCISDEYLGYNQHLIWECDKGHRWRAKPGNVVVGGTWCPICARVTPISIAEMKELAESRGGLCLSDEIKNCHTKLKWRCSEGHEWEALPTSVRRGSWCRICAQKKSSERQRYDSDYIRSFIIQKGGTWISGVYENTHSVLELKCDEGHIWKTAIGNILQGSWCHECGKNNKFTIQDMNEFAQHKGGKCLSDTYLGVAVKLRWQCEKEHSWEATPSSIARGTWCPICKKLNSKPVKHTIIEMNEIANSRGGKCLSKEYTNSRIKLEWECAKGHHWIDSFEHIQRGKWCPHCSDGKQVRLAELQKIAEKKNGKCLSSTYVNSNTKLLWECDNGHQWYAFPYSIKSGGWCKICAHKEKGTIEEMRELASTKKGKCLSIQYTSRSEKLEWMCQKKHKFMMPPSDVLGGHWCPRCAWNKNGMKSSVHLSDLQRLAELRNGRCISSKYLGYKVKHLWECNKGHQWEDTLWRIRRGYWCPVCNYGIYAFKSGH